ncbi:hypothetical protein MIMGU_mgv1a017413mg [Erythranthe guttata]|uniref:Uncharacterized protein n=1 Tax=Erythranthe guttata TaxID=4155 RepID=A0A022RPX7_ERYGU|nr:hypothetical protein MIMGU_mgv1a017413mg [Erythranthe guttata]
MAPSTSCLVRTRNSRKLSISIPIMMYLRNHAVSISERGVDLGRFRLANLCSLLAWINSLSRSKVGDRGGAAAATAG